MDISTTFLPVPVEGGGICSVAASLSPAVQRNLGATTMRGFVEKESRVC